MHLPRFVRIPMLILAIAHAGAAEPGNHAERLEWFRDLGFGMFIHWSHDSQLGSVISHSMVGADDAYLDRFIHELPKTFQPREFSPDDWADLARLAGMRYAMFTTKHHSGFCMFDTATTDFSIAHTPFRRDITREVFDAFRARGISAGVYFSPDDFHWLHRNKITIQRNVDAVQPRNHPGLMDLNRRQLRELMTGYGKIDMVFFDGEPDGLRELAWQLQPDTVVTRGAISTPEQHIPGTAMDEAWESCLTMGTQWQYKPTNEVLMSGGRIIAKLVETRAKGGNLLLNVGPRPDGRIPVEQEERLREVALWMFVNSECIYGVRPWIVTRENDLWFTHNRKTGTLYVIVMGERRWKFGEWREITLRSVKATDRTTAGILGQNDKALEYQPKVSPRTTFRQLDDGLRIRAMRAQRLYNDRAWPNPVVIRLTHVEPALVPPKIETGSARWDVDGNQAELRFEVTTTGSADRLVVDAQYRDITGLDVNERLENWITASARTECMTGRGLLRFGGLKAGRTYELRAVAEHPLLKVHGNPVRLRIP